jgi:hypothetical protein
MLRQVIRDTREKAGKGWHFGECSWCSGTQIQTLSTGDYTLEGLEDKLVIERKDDTSEISLNVNELRFVRELERLEQFEFPFIVCEFDMDDILNFPRNSGIPSYLWKSLKVSNHYILAKIVEFQAKYKTKWILCGKGNGQRVAACILKRVAEIIDGRVKSEPKPDLPRVNKKRPKAKG